MKIMRVTELDTLFERWEFAAGCAQSGRVLASQSDSPAHCDSTVK